MDSVKIAHPSREPIHQADIVCKISAIATSTMTIKDSAWSVLNAQDQKDLEQNASQMIAHLEKF